MVKLKMNILQLKLPQLKAKLNIPRFGVGAGCGVEKIISEDDLAFQRFGEVHLLSDAQQQSFMPGASG